MNTYEIHYEVNRDGSYCRTEDGYKKYYFHPLGNKLAQIVWLREQEKLGMVEYYKLNPNWLAVHNILYFPAIVEQMNEDLYWVAKHIKDKGKKYRKAIKFLKELKKCQ